MKRMLPWILVLAYLFIYLLTGCGPYLQMGGDKPPTWVDKLPKTPGKLCAVGYCGPTLYQPDCLKNAANNARGYLSESISSTIRVVTMDVSDGTRGYFSRDTFVQGSESISETVITGSKIEAQWVDLSGVRGGPKGCYSYVCVDPSESVDSFVEKLKEKKVPPKTIEKTRQNAAKAFEELERQEANR